VSAVPGCAEFIATLQARGIVLVADGERLIVRSDRSAVDAATVAAIRERKQALLDHLAARAVADLESVADGQRVAASATQQQLWWADDMHATDDDAVGDAYAVVAAHLVHGALDPVRWRDAVEAAMRRHGVFRTRFEERDGLLYQYLDQADPPPMATTPVDESDLSMLLDGYAAAVASPRRGEWVRHGLHRIDAERSVYVLACHHLLVDGRSIEVFFDDVARAYAPAGDSGAGVFPSPAPQFIDWIAREHRNAGETAAAIDYWRLQLQGAARRLRWPARDGGTEADACFAQALPDDLGEALVAYSKSTGIGLFGLCYAAFKILLRKHGGGEEFLIGHPVANRADEAFDAAMGCFTNTVILRARIDPEESFAAYAARVDAENLAGLAHQGAPLEAVAEHLERDEDGDSAPFQAFFALQRTRVPQIEGLRFERLSRLPSRAKFPLSLIVDRSDDRDADAPRRITLYWEYAGAHLSGAIVREMHARFVVLLSAALADPARPLARLSYLSQSDLAIAARMRAVAPPADAEGDLVSRFRAIARTHGASTALCSGDVVCSYAQLDLRSDALATRLREAGVNNGDLVGLWIPSGIERIVGLLAILKAGAAYVPVSGDMPIARQRELRDGLGLRLCLGPIGAIWADMPCARIDADEAAADASAPPPCARTAESVAYINFSSGTTGVPKAIACTDAGVLRLVIGQDYSRFGPELRMLCAAPIDFDAFTLELWAPLLNGGVCVLAGDGALTPAALREAIDAQGIDTAWLTSALFNTLVDIDPGLFAGLRQLLVGGDVVSPDHVARVYARADTAQLRIVNGYGPTENTTFTACFPIPRDWPADRPIPVGRPVRGTGVYVLDGDGEPAPPGVVGEIFATGTGLARGYVGQEALTRAAFELRWIDGRLQRGYRTGDHGYYDREGLLHFLGRRDGQVKINGHRIELAAIDSVLRAHPLVQDAASIAVKRDSLQRVVAFVVLVADDAGLPDAIEAHVAERLPAYHRPGQIVPIARMPLTANGKLDRGRLRSLSDAAATVAATRPLTTIEARLAAVWSRLLGHAILAHETDFFGAGGTSLLAMRMLAEVNALFVVRLRFRDLLRAPTLAGFAVALSSAPTAAGTPVAAAMQAPLSPRQRLLWNRYRIDRALDREDSAYNVHCAFELDGPLDQERFEAAMARVYRAHTSLHARIVDIDGEPVQQACPDPAWRVAWEEGGEDTIPEWLEAESRRRFALEHDAGLIVRVLRISPQRHLLQWNLPHLVTDGWSLEVAWDALAATYSDDAVPVATSDFGGYEVAAADRDRDADYWRERLAGHAALPFRPRIDAQASGADRARAATILVRELADDERAALTALATAAGTTPLAAALAAFAWLLHAFAGTARFAIGVPSANRERAGAEGWLGYHASILPLPFAPTTDATALEHVRAAQRTLREGLAHSEVDSDRLLRELLLDDGRDDNPLQRAVFAWQTHAPSPRALGPVRVRRCPTPSAAPKFPMLLTMHDTGDGVRVCWEFDPAVFDQDVADALERAYRRVLSAFCAMPDARSDELLDALSAELPRYDPPRPTDPGSRSD